MEQLVPPVAFKTEEPIFKMAKSHIKRATTTIDRFNRLVRLKPAQMRLHQPLNHHSCLMLNQLIQQYLTTTWIEDTTTQLMVANEHTTAITTMGMAISIVVGTTIGTNHKQLIQTWKSKLWIIFLLVISSNAALFEFWLNLLLVKKWKAAT